MVRILLVADVEGWAWWHMANGLKRYHPEGVEYSVISQQQLGVFTSNCQFLLAEFAAIVQFSWTEATHRGIENPVPLPERNCTVLASHGAEFPYPPVGSSVSEKIATQLRNSARAKASLPKFDKVLCVSQRLKDVADTFTDKAVLTLPGVDHRLFRKTEIPDRENIVVGWCGQSTGITKGYREVLVPLMERDIPGVDFCINDRSAQNAKTHHEMAVWYRDIDVFLSTSCSEGFQMPPLEAMACGRPVIATDSGGIPQLVEQAVTGWILPGWDTECDASGAVNNLTNTIRRLTRDEIRKRGAASRQRVECEFTWEQRSPEWAAAILG